MKSSYFFGGSLMNLIQSAEPSQEFMSSKDSPDGEPAAA